MYKTINYLAHNFQVDKIDLRGKRPWTNKLIQEGWDVPSPEEHALMHLHRAELNLSAESYWTKESRGGIMACQFTHGERITVGAAFKTTPKNIRLIKRL